MKVGVESLLRKRTIIYGEAGSGKTRLLAELLNMLSKLLPPSQITIIDLAPDRLGNIGGPVTQYTDVTVFRYLRPLKVYAPRLMASNAEDVLRYAGHNVEEARKCFRLFAASPTKLLAVNDLTIFLHGAEAEELTEYLDMAETFIATAYYGQSLAEDYGTGLSAKERERVERLLALVDVKVRLNSEPGP
ncbi:MAG: hypothetical protein QW614_00785 [Candidatus Caldarchaeum sp.]|uniref:Helicase HerA central domain-containing protein n=1 Tax=Caldiarchaeum subterraneum TaxID=311458 RepID=A0A7C5L9A0_CALS0